MIDLIETVVRTELPVDEDLKILKHRLMPDGHKRLNLKRIIKG